MALVKRFSIVRKERQSIHALTECTASVVSEGGRKYVQLDTYGSAERQLRGKVSQSIQFSEEAATQLKKLIEETYPHLAGK